MKDSLAISSKGRLFIVSTPIGNMEDISYRAERVLKEVYLTAAEDTRHTGLLLKHLNIRTSLVSFHEHNEQKRIPKIIETLQSGYDVALVCDAGTPGISDPAYPLIVQAIENNIEVLSIPGPSAFLAALVVSGLPTDRFVFEGFLPAKSSKRKKRLEGLKDDARTLVFYESPFRLVSMLTDALEVFGDRRASVSRELTKKFEETKRGTLKDLLEGFRNSKLKGEFVVVLEGRSRKSLLGT